jgi:hypothetical protein
MSDKPGQLVRLLILRELSYAVLPNDGGSMSGLLRIKELAPVEFSEAYTQVAMMVRRMIAEFKAGPANKFGDDDEAIAAEFLIDLEERRRK